MGGVCGRVRVRIRWGGFVAWGLRYVRMLLENVFEYRCGR